MSNDDDPFEWDGLREGLEELEIVRFQLQEPLFSVATSARIDALRASAHHQLEERGIDPSSENQEFELTWMVAGGIVAELLSSDSVMAMLADVPADDTDSRAARRGAMAAHLFWATGISPHPIEKLPR